MPTEYTDSKGVTTPIAELNNFHLVNGMLKVATKQHSAEDTEGIAAGLAMVSALKAEVLKRLAPKE